eukprot:Hpha_TRINITY_DN14589_c0_g3::TRINITY_DN14589_c0_g3_i1::g.46457::m.46457
MVGGGVCVAGLSCVDLQLLGAKPLAHAEAREVVEGVKQRSGGIVSNSGRALVELGVASSVEVRSVVGADPLGDSLTTEWKAMGMETDRVVRNPSHSTHLSVMIVSEEGRWGVYSHPGVSTQASPTELLGEELEKGKHGFFLFGYPHTMPHLQGTDLRELCVKARESGAAVVLDCNQAQRVREAEADGTPKALSIIAPALEVAAGVHANAVEASAMTGVGGSELLDAPGNPDNIATVPQVLSMCRALIDRGACLVLLTIGPSGGVIATGSEASFREKLPQLNAKEWADRAVYVPSRQLELKPVTTGAGDSFTAGFLSGVLRGDSLDDSAQLAAAAAHCRVDGGREIPKAADALAHWRSRPVSQSIPNPAFAVLAKEAATRDKFTCDLPIGPARSG